MLSRIFLTISLTALALSAQNTDGAGTGTGSTTIFPPYIASYKELQQYLTLTDQQLESLRSIQAQRDQALQAIFKQSGDKQTELYQLLQAGSTVYFPVVQECEKGVARWIEIPTGGAAPDHANESSQPAPALRLLPRR